MANSLKILVCGDVQGNLDLVYGRVEKFLKKGTVFDMLLCVGDFFGDDEALLSNWLSYRNGTKKAPIATYLLGPNQLSHVNQFNVGTDDGFEFCENITYLGKKGFFTGVSGIRIAYLSGCESPSGSGPAPKHCFSQNDINSLSSSLNTSSSQYKGIDIFLTSTWPKGVSEKGNAPSAERCKSCGSEMVAELARCLKPRYHFAALEGINYERLPYRNHKVLAESTRHVTRFISLAPVGNANKQKYLYAFTISPMKDIKLSDLNYQPDDATECPYKERATQGGEGDQYRWNMKQTKAPARKRKSDGNHNGPEKKHERPQNWSCWFCLGGEKVEKHLVASVGDLCYVAMAKGGLVPHHVLVLPIAHHSSSLDLPDDTRAEAEKFKQALMDAFYSEGRPCVIFERNYRTDHMQIQVVPLPPGITSDDITKAFHSLAEKQVDRHGRPCPIELTELPKETDLKQILSPGCPFFHVELPDGSRLFHRIQKYFPLQFGREALCSDLVLSEPTRADWRLCTLSRDNETATTQRFRDFFKGFDFTLEDDDD